VRNCLGEQIVNNISEEPAAFAPLYWSCRWYVPTNLC